MKGRGLQAIPCLIIYVGLFLGLSESCSDCSSARLFFVSKGMLTKCAEKTKLNERLHLFAFVHVLS